jgi:hypothetical protein
MSTDKELPVLSLDLMRRTGAFVGMTPGHSLAYRYCQDVEKNIQPSKKDMKIVAFALRAIIEMKESTTEEIMSEVAKRLGLKKKQGKRISAERKATKNAEIVALYLLEVENMIEAGTGKKKAEIVARQPFCEKLGIGDRRFRDMIREYRERAEIVLPHMRS